MAAKDSHSRTLALMVVYTCMRGLAIQPRNLGEARKLEGRGLIGSQSDCTTLAFQI